MCALPRACIVQSPAYTLLYDVLQSMQPAIRSMGAFGSFTGIGRPHLLAAIGSGEGEGGEEQQPSAPQDEPGPLQLGLMHSKSEALQEQQQPSQLLHHTHSQPQQSRPQQLLDAVSTQSTAATSALADSVLMPPPPPRPARIPAMGPTHQDASDQSDLSHEGSMAPDTPKANHEVPSPELAKIDLMQPASPQSTLHTSPLSTQSAQSGGHPADTKASMRAKTVPRRPSLVALCAAENSWGPASEKLNLASGNGQALAPSLQATHLHGFASMPAQRSQQLSAAAMTAQLPPGEQQSTATSTFTCQQAQQLPQVTALPSTLALINQSGGRRRTSVGSSGTLTRSHSAGEALVGSAVADLLPSESDDAPSTPHIAPQLLQPFQVCASIHTAPPQDG